MAFEYTSIIMGYGILIGMLFWLSEKMSFPDPLGIGIVEYFKLALRSVALVFGLPLLGAMTEIMRLQTGWQNSTIVLTESYYGVWMWIIIIYLLFIVIYNFFLVPAMAKSLVEAQNKKDKYG